MPGLGWRALLCLLIAAATWSCSSDEPSAPTAQVQSGCSTDADCAIGQRCDFGECWTPIECQATSDCLDGSRSVCDGVAHECVQCLADGDCAAGEACTNERRCAAPICEPSPRRCSADGLRIEQCAADGRSSRVLEQCSDGQVCRDAQCEEIACEPGRAFCKGGHVYECAADGRTSAESAHCAAGFYCDSNSASCRPRQCTPGEMSCVDDGIARCKGDGSGYGSVTACGDAQRCDSGACVDIGCLPGSRACRGASTVIGCNESGTQSFVLTQCGSSSHCVQGEMTASCSNDPCAPSSLACAGNLLTQCSADGAGYESGGTDCGASGKVCVSGACVPKLCESGSLSCQQGSVYLCTDNGSARKPFKACLAGSYCDGPSASCKPQACVPGTLGCTGSSVATCSSDGSGFLASGTIDCGTSGQVCDGGACKAVSCSPNTQFCKNGDPYTCSASGTSATLLADCNDATQHCVKSGNSAFCAADVCTAGSTNCFGKTLAQCNAEGSAYSSTTVCAEMCQSGACVSGSCVPGKYACLDGDSMLCSASGFNQLSMQCKGPFSCSSATGKCSFAACNAGLATCLGDVPGTCDALGAVETSVGTSCAASGKVCAAGACVASTIDQTSGALDSLPHVFSDLLVGSYVYVTSPRTLTNIQAYFLTSSFDTTRWLVYVSDQQTGPYVPAFDRLQPANTGNLAWQGSGAISVPLDEGKYYLIGALLNSNLDLTGDLASTFPFLSFGRVLGSWMDSQTFGVPPASISPLGFYAQQVGLQLTTVAQ